MKKIKDQIFVCLDCETTGLDIHKDEIIEIALIVFREGEIIDSFETLVQPRVLISEESQKIHHISQEMCEGKPFIEEVLPVVFEKVKKHILMGHGIGFDIDMCVNAATRAGIPHTLKENLVIDTLRLARHYGESPTNSLQELRRHFNVELQEAHRAMSDVVVNKEVFYKLVRNFKSVEEIFEVLESPIFMKAMPLGKHKGRLLKEIPIAYLLWASNQEFDRDLLFSLRSEIKRRKKGNPFETSGNPFAGL